MKFIVIPLLLILSITKIIPQTYTDSEVIYTSSHFILSNNNTYIDTTLLQINNRNADSEIRIYYSKGDKVTIGDVWIEDLSGNVIRELNNRDIKDKRAISHSIMYDDRFIKYFNLKHNIYPYRIYYTSQVRYARSLGIFEIDNSWSKVSIHNAKVYISPQINRAVKNISYFYNCYGKEKEYYIKNQG